MHFMLQACPAAAGQAVSAAILVAGFIMSLRLFGRWRHDTLSRHAIDAAVRRLQARPYQSLDAGVLLLALLLPTLLNCIRHREPPASAAVQVGPALLYYAIILGGVLAAARRAGIDVYSAIGITRATLRPAAKAGLVLGLATLPPVILTAWLSEWALQQMGVPFSRQAVFDTLADPNLGAATQALLVVVAVAAAPLAEEAVFRGILFPAALGNRGLIRALLLVNILFALLHLHLPSFLPLLVVGFCLSLGMLTTGSLLTPIIMHAIFNGEMLLLFYAWPAMAS